MPSLMALIEPVVSLGAVQDSTRRPLVFDLIDSTVDVTLLGDKITPVIQWLFQKEPWVMWAGALLGAAIAIAVLAWLWVHRQTVLGWLTTRNTRVKTALVATAVLAVVAGGGLAYKANDFVSHDKRFCNGCHIFVGTDQAWVKPDSGDYTVVPKLEGKHDSIGCHTCHPLKPMKEQSSSSSGCPDSVISPAARQGAAGDLRGLPCEGPGGRVAGGRRHRRAPDPSPSPTRRLSGRGRVPHLPRPHRPPLPPTDSTCGRSECHKMDETKIVLGKMKGQGDFHCVGCHEFTAKVPALATRDSAASTLTPAIKSCFRCHAMQERLPDFDERKDPHNGTCGMCHKPHPDHEQEGSRPIRRSAVALERDSFMRAPTPQKAKSAPVSRTCIRWTQRLRPLPSRVRDTPRGDSFRLPFDTSKHSSRSAPVVRPRPVPQARTAQQSEGCAPPDDDQGGR
jgi:hypothetical protein